jgi:hypothetical protein
VLRSGSPRNEAGPVTDSKAPIFMGGAANTVPAIKTLKNKTQTVLKILLDIHTSI